MMRKIIRFRNPFSDEYELVRDRDVEDAAYARKLAERDGVPDPGSEQIRFHESLQNGRQERLYPMVSFRLAAGARCWRCHMPMMRMSSEANEFWLFGRTQVNIMVS